MDGDRVAGAAWRASSACGLAHGQARGLATDATPEPPAPAAFGLAEVGEAEYEREFEDGDEDRESLAGATIVDGQYGMGLSKTDLRALQASARVPLRFPTGLRPETEGHLRTLLKDTTLDHITALHEKLSARRTARLQALKRDEASVPPLRYSWRESVAYTAMDLAPAVGITRRVLQDTVNRVGAARAASYRTMLDFGGGPGTALLAAEQVHQPGLPIKEYTMVEPSRSMWEVAQLLRHGEQDLSRPVEDLLADMRSQGISDEAALLWSPSLPELLQGLNPEQYPTYDVVTATFALSELPSAEARAMALGLLWRLVAPNGVLVVAERADKGSINVVQDAREFLVEKEALQRALRRTLKVDAFGDCEAKMVAPCTHSQSCPIAQGAFGQGRFTKGCQFVQAAHRTISRPSGKGQGLGAPSSRFAFSYFAAMKVPNGEAEGGQGGRGGEEAGEFGEFGKFGEGGLPGRGQLEGDEYDVRARIVRNPFARKGHVTMDLCTSDGELQRVSLTKGTSEPRMYRAARKATWGGFWFAQTSPEPPKQRPSVGDLLREDGDDDDDDTRW